ncbi:MAG TPA: AbrB/MazE/SpoVT family DNA-binding domain-containing protein [Pseudonocardiaceae bacterium]|nr:AbrB/MazE/SpoVT family DNA-binding domain-containing protein [Pseudonocardiaceae bacterium]
MTGTVITPVVIPAATPHGGHPAGSLFGTLAARRRLPLPTLSTLSTRRASSAVYGLAAVDCRGRVADRAVVSALGWASGTRLNIRESGGLLVIRTDAHGVFSVTNQGHLRLPATVRHCCGLVPGDRVFLAADPQRDLLIVHPPAALDDLFAQRHAGLLDGDLT